MRPTKWIETFGIVVCLATSAHAQAAAQAGEIRVRVLAAETQKPMPDVEVSLNPVYCGNCPEYGVDLLAHLQGLAASRGIDVADRLTDGPAIPAPRTAVSDEAGLAVFRDLKLTKYQITAKRAGHVVAWLAESSLVVTLDKDQRAREMLVALYPAATISGRVQDSKGEVVPNAIVLVTRVRDEMGNPMFAQRRAVVSPDGRYAVTVEAPGEFRLNAQAKAQELSRTAALEREKVVTVEAGKNLSDIDLDLPAMAQ